MDTAVINSKEVKIFTVKDITANVKKVLRSNFSKIYIKGEISNAKLSSLGHYFFSLKDEDALLNCVMFRNAYNKLKFNIEDGINVVAFGTISVFEKRGSYNFIVENIMPEGKGALQLAFEQLKKKLSDEGLFNEQYKKPLPEFPKKIGVITSPTGAAFKDIIKVINRRFPNLHILLYPSKVQGEGAAETIAKGIKVFNKFFPVDVIIVGRGGGSLEDLWPFNEEIVARAIFDSRIPVISAVGHEIDYTISDFVADKRAATPSAAAEIVTQVKSEILDYIESMQNKLMGLISDIYQDFSLEFDRYYEQFKNISGNFIVDKRNRFNLLFQKFIHKFDNLIEPKQKEVDFLLHRLIESYSNDLKYKKNTFVNLLNKLNLLNPFQILSRGYSITYKLPEHKIVKSCNEVKVKDKVKIKFGDGAVLCEIIDENNTAKTKKNISKSDKKINDKGELLLWNKN